jgi:phosphoglycolate phosphatase-like HAD superfamily hydrolase
MTVETFLVRTMSDTVETDIQRVYVIANEILPRYGLPILTFEQLRKIAEIRRHALEIAQKHGYDVNPPGFIAGIEKSLQEAKAAGLKNILMTTGGRRYKHDAMEKAGIGGYFDEIVDRDETYYAKEQGLYYLYRKHRPKHMRIVVLSGTATYIKAANNAHGCKVGDTYLEVIPIALSTEHSYNDEETLKAARPKALIRSYDELLTKLKELAPLG